MKKILSIIAIFLVTICITGCSKYKSYTFDVSTGDKIEVKLHTNGGYDLTSDLPIKFTKNEKEVGQGSFFKSEAYDLYYDEVINSNASILKEDDNGKVKYFFYRYQGEDHIEYDYIIKIKKSNTVFILATTNKESDAEELFANLEFNVVK